LQGRSFRGQEQKTLLWFFRFLHLQKLPEIKGSSRLILLTPDDKPARLWKGSGLGQFCYIDIACAAKFVGQRKSTPKSPNQIMCVSHILISCVWALNNML